MSLAVKLEIAPRMVSMLSMCAWPNIEDRSARNAATTSKMTPVNLNALVTLSRRVELFWMENKRICACTAARKVA